MIKLTDILREVRSCPIDIDRYAHGECELFALALYRELGYDMMFFMDGEAEFDDGEFGDALTHAYNKSEDGRLFDATGEVTMTQIEDDHGDYNDPYHIQVDEKMFVDIMGYHFDVEIIDKLRDYIRDNIEKYS